MFYQSPLGLSLSKATRYRSLLVVALTLAAGAAKAESPLQLPDIDYVRVEKAARTMTLFSEGRPVHTITGLQLGDAPVGPKRFEGDERTPEGRYTIDYGNPNSAYRLSLHISYPGARDVAFARSHGRSPGGQIFIHGQPNGWPGADAGTRVPGDWTDGCIAVSNAEIDVLWEVVLDGATIDIVP